MAEKVQQLEMQFERDARSADAFRNELCQHGGRVTDLAITRNRVSMVSVRFDGAGGARVRVHEFFLRAPEDVVVALGRYLAKRSRHEWNIVGRYVRRHAADSGAPKAESRPMPVRGRTYDLGVIYDDINRRFFAGKVECGIGWGKRGARRRGRVRMRTIRFGSYCKAGNIIRIHPMLDQERVPREFVEYIVFHEMLHAAMPSVEGRSRNMHHHRAYRMLERRFPDYERMQEIAAQLVPAEGKRGMGDGLPPKVVTQGAFH